MYLNCNGWSVKAGGADFGGGSTKSSLSTSICNFDTPSMHELLGQPWLWDFLYSCDFWKSFRTVVFYEIVENKCYMERWNNTYVQFELILTLKHSRSTLDSSGLVDIDFKNETAATRRLFQCHGKEYENEKINPWHCI